MLNELSSFAKGLDERGIEIISRSDALKSATKLPGFIFLFDEQSGINGVEFVDAESMTHRWKVAETKFKSFPIMNLNDPLYLVGNSLLLDFSKRLTESLNKNQSVEFLQSCFDRFEICLNSVSAVENLLRSESNEEEKSNAKEQAQKHIKRFTDSGCLYPKELLKRTDGESEFFQLAKTMSNWFGDDSGDALRLRGEQLAKQMADYIRNAFLEGRIKDANSVCAALFGRWNKKKGEFDAPKLQIGFALKKNPDSTFTDSIDEVNQALLSSSESGVKGICSLSGENASLIIESFPEVTLKGVGQTRLFSMFDQIPAQFRYGKSGSMTFPASEIEVNKYANALQTICAEEFNGKIWQTIPSATPKKSDLLIAWLTGEKVTRNPLLDQLASLCGALESTQAISQYVAQVEKLVEAFSKPIEISPSVEQHILVLTQVDNARREVVANLTYNLVDVAAGISNWTKHAKQAIHFKLPSKFKGEDKTTSLAPYIPSPRSMMELFRKLYLRSGKVESLHGLQVCRVFDLFLRPPSNRQILENELLERLLKCVQELLINIRQAQIVSSAFGQSKDKQDQRKGSEILQPFSVQARHDVLVSLSFLEILLGRLEKNNRRYPMSAVFQLGKLLAKVDELHLAYSRQVRKNDIPNQLIGNSLIRIAMQNPVQALDRLGEKLPVYQNWAKVHNAQAKDSFVEMLLSQMGRVSRSIDLDELGQPVTSKTKAALLLGYMAWEKKNEGGEE